MTTFIVSIVAGLALATVASAVHLFKEYISVKHKLEEKAQADKHRGPAESIV